MTRLQGNWLMTEAIETGQREVRFFLWGEAWQRSNRPDQEMEAFAVQPHPYCLDLASLRQWFAQTPNFGFSNLQPDAQGCTIVVPTCDGMPILSEQRILPEQDVYLQPWRLDGVSLSGRSAIDWLSRLPLRPGETEEVWMSQSLQFWVHVMRWTLSLLVRGKFMPQVEGDGDRLYAQWQALLDSTTDQQMLQHFVHHFPSSGLFYSPLVDVPPQIDVSAQPDTFLKAIVNHLIDVRVRSGSPQTVAMPTAPWLGEMPQVVPPEMARLLRSWVSPLERSQVNVRVALQLTPPMYGARDWQISYGMQAIDKPDLWLDAKTIWKQSSAQIDLAGRSVRDPQEMLLSGLGTASKLFPAIEPSLKTSRPVECVLDPTQAYDLIRFTSLQLQEHGIGVILPPGLADRSGGVAKFGIKLSADLPKLKGQEKLGLNGVLNFKWELAIGKHTLSKKEFDRLVALNMPLVEINGEWVELRAADIKAAKAFFENRKANPTLTLEDILRIRSGEGKIIEKLAVVDFEASGVLQELIRSLQDTQAVEAIEAPTDFAGTLRPYQGRGVGWLAFLEQWGLGACLADDMGLGKTLQFLGFLLHLKSEKSLNAPVLLICPTSVMGNWEREAKKFAPSLRVMLHHGSGRSIAGTFQKAIQKYDLVITSYALVSRDLATLKPVQWRGLALDEAQNIKNAESKQSIAVRELDGKFKIALTGTPVENRLTELWSIMDFLNPGYLGSKPFFQRRFAIPIEKYGDTQTLQTLRQLVQPFILRRLKTDRSIIQDLPAKQEMTVFCNLTPAQANVYQTAVDEALEAIDEADGIQRRGLILALLTRLKQICNHPALSTGKMPVPKQLLTDSGKLQRLSEMLEVITGQGDRVLIFTQFSEWGKQLQQALAQTLNEEVLFLYGSTPRSKREEMVDRFQQDPRAPKIFILSLKAGGVGLNLTRANHVFHFDRWWNPAVENQATDRAFRIGQTRNVQVHKFVCIGTLEERIHDLIESKKVLAEQVVGAGENWITELNTDQLRQLLVLDRSAIINE